MTKRTFQKFQDFNLIKFDWFPGLPLGFINPDEIA